jgi:hypothetical protein
MYTSGKKGTSENIADAVDARIRTPEIKYYEKNLC